MITIHNEEEFGLMRRSGKLAAEVLDFITPFVVPGVSTGELNDRCHEFILANGAIPAPLNYMGFPKSICTSVNEAICHGIPSEKKILKEGDIINIDITVILDEFHGDTSRMFVLPGAKVKPKRLVKCTYEAMMAGINVVKPGIKLIEISKAIQKVADSYGYGEGVVRDFSGHGIGRIFHAAPQISHFYTRESENYREQHIELVPGMFFTVEPMINTGSWKMRVMEDKWLAKTRDGGLSAQFEHTVGVTETGFEIFTLSPRGWHYPHYD